MNITWKEFKQRVEEYQIEDDDQLSVIALYNNKSREDSVIDAYKNQEGKWVIRGW